MIEWLRPAWLLVLPAALALAWAWWRARTGAGPWRRIVDPALLAELAGRAPAGGSRLALGLGAALLVLLCAALAGPSWRTQTVALHRDAGARIVVLDLSPSMDAVDVAPTRLERARRRRTCSGMPRARSSGWSCSAPTPSASRRSPPIPPCSCTCSKASPPAWCRAQAADPTSRWSSRAGSSPTPAPREAK